MNPKQKFNVRNNKSMIALLVGGVVFFTSCTKDNSIGETNSPAPVITETATVVTSEESNSVSALARTGDPIAKAGSDQSITLPVNSVNLDGSGSSDAGGSIRYYAWTKEVGPSGTIASPSSSRTSVTGLAAGEYRFKLKVTDNSGATATDTLHVSVKGTGGSPTNPAPVVNAGNAQTITLPVSSVTLSGSATDANGTVVSYQWTKVSGNGGSITNQNAATTTVTGLTAGAYVFNLKATDNGGASGNKTVNVTVNSGSSTPPPGNYGTLVYSTGYNTVNDLDPYGSGQWGAGTLASHLSTSIYKTGPGAFKSFPASVSSGIRSEVQYPASLTANEGTIEYDVMYETIFQGQGHSLQFHPNTSGGSASPGLWHENGKFTWVNWKGGSNTKYPTNYTIPQNRWIHCVLEYKFGSAGYMKFTIDGVVVLNATNIQVGDGSGQYLKVGVNMWASQSSVVYYDNLKIWKK